MFLIWANVKFCLIKKYRIIPIIYIRNKSITENNGLEKINEVKKIKKKLGMISLNSIKGLKYIKSNRYNVDKASCHISVKKRHCKYILFEGLNIKNSNF